MTSVSECRTSVPGRTATPNMKQPHIQTAIYVILLVGQVWEVVD